MDQPGMNQDSPAFVMFTQVTFFLSLVGMIIGICFLPVDFWIRGYLGIGLFFSISSTIILSKTMRDQHEAKKFLNKLHEVKTEKMLKEFELK